jgi:hypothetical protein
VRPAQEGGKLFGRGVAGEGFAGFPAVAALLRVARSDSTVFADFPEAH